MTTTLKSLLIRAAIRILEILLNRFLQKTEGNGKPSTEFKQDVRINTDTAKLINDFIKAHTVESK